MASKYLSALLTAVLVATPAYSQVSDNSPKQESRLETIASQHSTNPKRKEPTREDYLKEFKSLLGQRYSAMQKDPVKKAIWEKYWENAPTSALKFLISFYEPEKTKDYKSKLSNKKLQEPLKVEPVYSYIFPWIQHQNPTSNDKELVNKFETDIKQATKLPKSIFSPF